MPLSERVSTTILETLGVPVTETNREQLRVLIEAFDIFVERNREYNDLWKEYGLEDISLHVRSKHERLQRVGRDDDALDLIIYTAFWLRLKRGV